MLRNASVQTQLSYAYFIATGATLLLASAGIVRGVYDQHPLASGVASFVLVTALIILVASLTTVFILSHLRRLITKPISDIEKAVNTITETKDYSTPLPEIKNNELGALINGLNNMVRLVKRSEETLEGKVTLRTKELSEVNGILLAELETRKRTEQELKISKIAAEAVNDSKSEFLANMSHELRTPLNGILGFTEITLDSTLSSRQRENLEKVQSSAETLLNRLNGILDLSLIKSGQVRLQKERVNTLSIIESVANHISSAARSKGLELIVSYDWRLPDEVACDSDKLVQALLNLAENGVKFTESGKVEIGASSVSKANGAISTRFYVKDSGIGMQKELLGKIFERFYQISTPSGRARDGVGIGATTAKDLVELMGSEICVTSELGSGSEFSFTLDLEELEHPAGRFDMDTDYLEEMYVVIIDDNITSGKALESSISSLGINTKAYDNIENSPCSIVMHNKNINCGQYILLVNTDTAKTEPKWQSGEVCRVMKERGGKTIAMVWPEKAINHSPYDKVLHKPVMPSHLKSTILSMASERVIRTHSSLSNDYDDIADGTGQLRILLAEDSQMNSQLATIWLKKMGHMVTVAKTGLEAVNKWENEDYDLIFMDIQMPEMDGFEATAKIREREAELGGHTPIIALTAHAVMGYYKNCIDAGMDDYISKPFTANSLKLGIEKSLATYKPRDSSEQSIKRA